jgi:hypothetical protein
MHFWLCIKFKKSRLFNWHYSWQVGVSFQKLKLPNMIKNYLVTAYRTLMRKKGTSLLNIAGLSLGITGSIVLFLLLQYHTGFDKFQSKYDRIYRVVSYSKGNDGELNYSAGIPTVLPAPFRVDFPEAE